MFHVKHRAEALVLNIESAIPLHTTTPDRGPDRSLSRISLLRMFHVKHAQTAANHPAS